MITAIYPGTYDPVTNGHIDVIRRAASIFDRIVVGVVRDPHHKATMFSLNERVAFLEEALAPLPNVTVDVFHELVVDFATQNNPLPAIDGITPFPAWFQMEPCFRMNAKQSVVCAGAATQGAASHFPKAGGRSARFAGQSTQPPRKSGR